MTKPTPLRAVAGDQVRELPHNIQAEQVVLGAVMLAPRALDEVRELLDGSEFYRPAHTRIWEAITALADSGDPYDILAVAPALGRDLTKVGGGPYLHTLTSVVPVTESAGYYAHMVRDLAYARQVIETGTRLTQIGHAAVAEGIGPGLRAEVAAACAAVTATDVRGWAGPAPLSSHRELPGFPAWALPEWAGEYAAGLAEVTQTPPDLACCLALAVLAVAAGGKVWVNAGLWTEPTCLYTVIVLPPGNRKSEVFAKMTAPIRAAEKILTEAAEPLIEHAALERRIAEADAEKAEKAAIAAVEAAHRNEALANASAAAMALKQITVPPKPRLFADDATVETLTSLLAEQGGRFAVLSPEGEMFSIAAGRYSGTPNFAILKHGHAGEGTRIDRISRAPEQIDAATITVGICTQPDVLAELGDTPQFRGQGLLGRMLYSVPTSLLGYRKERPDPVPEHITQQYTANLTTLILSLNDVPEPATLTFTPEAQDAIVALLAATEPRFRPGGDLAHMTDWGGKYVGAVVRIAALLHIAEHFRDPTGGWAQPIQAGTFTDATEIGEYFVTHAQAAYDAIGADPAVAGARAILDWARNTATTRFTARDVLPPLRNRFKKVADLDPALRVLETHGWIRRIPAPPQTGRGRPTAPAYDLHPTITTGDDPA